MKLGIIGAGKIVHDFLSISNKINDTKLTAISAPPRNINMLNELKGKYHIEKIYTNNQDLFNDHNVDTVYVAVPNSFHYSICKEALQAGKNVICEKPFVYTVKEAKELKRIADNQNVMLIEAITNIYLKNYFEIKDKLNQLGSINIVNLNYTQLSTRYPELLKGNLLPVFDPKKGGGNLMDLGIYAIHLAVGWFGLPDKVKYYKNIRYGTDTSGILILVYKGFICSLVVAKDSYCKPVSFIEGEKGSIRINGLINKLPSFNLEFPDCLEKDINYNLYDHRMIAEFNTFSRWIDISDFESENKAFTHSIKTLKVLELAKESMKESD